MPSTFESKEEFSKGKVTEDEMKILVKLRLKAGAIKSEYKGVGDNWVLITTWNVWGE